VLEQVDVVARDQHRDADFVEAAEDLHHFERQIRVEVAGRLVGDEDRRLAHDGARDADALLLAGRQLQRRALLAPQQSDLIERGAHALADFLGADAGDDQRQRDVVEDRAVVEQLVILEHHADLAAIRRHLATSDAGDVLAVHDQLTAARPLDQRDELQQARFTGAGVTGDEHDLAGRDLQRQVAERLTAVRIAFEDVIEADHSRFNSASTNASASNSAKSSALSPMPM
jgi:hypothetical protein